mgnify:FL=1
MVGEPGAHFFPHCGIGSLHSRLRSTTQVLHTAVRMSGSEQFAGCSSPHLMAISSSHPCTLLKYGMITHYCRFPLVKIANNGTNHGSVIGAHGFEPVHILLNICSIMDSKHWISLVIIRRKPLILRTPRARK